MDSQKELFNDKLPELIVRKPKENDFLYYCGILETGYSSDNLSAIIATFKPLYYGKRVYELDTKTGHKELSDIVSKLQTGKSARKIEKVRFLALFLSCKENLVLYCNSLPKEICELWKKILRKGYLSSDEVSSILGYDGIISSGYYGSCINLHPKLAFFKLVKGKNGIIGRFNYPESGYFLYIIPLFYRLFYPYFYDKSGRRFNKRWSPDSDEKLKVFRGEAAFVREFPLMLSLQKQKALYIGDSKKMSLTLLKKAAQQIGTEEFFPESKDAELSRLRSVLLFNMFTSFMEEYNQRKTKESPEIVKDIVGNLFYKYTIMGACMFPHITGIKQNCIFESYIETVNINLQGYFYAQKEDRWFDIEEIIDYVAYMSEGKSLQLFNIYGLDKQNLINKRNGKMIGLHQVADNLGIPFLKAYILLLCSLGVLDIAYRDYSEIDLSYVDWIRYCRLTNLGRYVFGITNKYEPEVIIEDKRYFELDSDRLIIKSIEKENPYEKLLLDIAEPIGGTRYKISCASFLRSCKDINDVSSKIDFFKRFISNEWSDIWKSFFDSLMMKCNPFNSVSSDNYLMYKLDSNNKELIQLLVSDKILKENVIKAEGYIVLISKSNKKKVFDRLKDLGYMM